jgi:hypothetical protein
MVLNLAGLVDPRLTSLTLAVAAIGLVCVAPGSAAGADAAEAGASPAWLHSTAGISHQVLAPWTPLVVTQGSAGPVVKPWGRAYAFGAGPFPTSVVSRDAEMLAGPMSLRLVVEGKPVTLVGSLRVARQTGAQVVLSGTASGGGVEVASRVTVDFDGDAWAEFSIKARHAVQIDELVVQAPVKRQHAQYLYRYPGSWNTSENSRALSPTGWNGAFVPYVWVGDNDRGLAVYTESDEFWQSADRKRAVELTPEGETVAVRFNVIGIPLALRPDGHPLKLRFGFEATPVKQPAKDVWDYRIVHYGNYGIENQLMGSISRLTYRGPQALRADAGTLELWARVRFDPNAPVASEASRGTLNRDLLTIEGGDVTLGLYWNIDDRGMRVYLKQGATYPVVAGAPSDWHEGELHHLALSWGDELRVYVDGKLTVHQPRKGSVVGPADRVTLAFGGAAPGFDVDELRISDIQREPDASGGERQADDHTILLDRLDSLNGAAAKTTTTPVKGAPGVVEGSGELVGGKVGRAFAVLSGKPRLMLDYLKEIGVRTIVFHEHWTEYQNYPRTFMHQAQLHSVVKACHERGIQLLLYFGYQMADTCPEWDAYHDQVLVMPRQGDYTREPRQTDYTVCYASVWQDFLLDGIDKLMSEYDIDGVYLDGTELPWACANLRHGCGYVRADGSVAPTYTMRATREMMRRIYTIVKAHRPDGQVNVHNSTCMTMPTLGWATSSWDGEQFGSIAVGADVEQLLPLDAFRCEFMGRQWGVPAEFLCYDQPYTQHQALSFTLLHDVLVRCQGVALEEEASLWHAMEAFGRKQATFMPYYSNSAVAKTSPDHSYVSLYSRPGVGVMCVVSHFGNQSAEVKVTLDTAALKLPAGAKAADARNGVAIPMRDGSFTVPLAPYDYALVRISG